MTQIKSGKSRSKRQTVTTIVTDRLREQIIVGDFKGGEPLRQDALANLYDTSHIPVREALLALEAEGLVTFIPHKGAVVKEISSDEINELFSLRALLECDILRHAFQKMKTSDFETAETILGDFEALLVPNAETKSWSALNWEFHRTLYLPARRELELNFIENLHVISNRYLRLQVEISGSYPKADKEHHEILNYCKNGDKRSALKLLKEHIEYTKEDLVENLKF